MKRISDMIAWAMVVAGVLIRSFLLAFSLSTFITGLVWFVMEVLLQREGFPLHEAWRYSFFIFLGVEVGSLLTPVVRNILRDIPHILRVKRDFHVPLSFAIRYRKNSRAYILFQRDRPVGYEPWSDLEFHIWNKGQDSA